MQSTYSLESTWIKTQYSRGLVGALLRSGEITCLFICVFKGLNICSHCTESFTHFKDYNTLKLR